MVQANAATCTMWIKGPLAVRLLYRWAPGAESGNLLFLLFRLILVHCFPDLFIRFPSIVEVTRHAVIVVLPSFVSRNVNKSSLPLYSQESRIKMPS